MFYKKADEIQQETMMNGDWNIFAFAWVFQLVELFLLQQGVTSPPWDDGMALSMCPGVPLHCTAGLAARANITGTWRGDVLNHSSCLGVTNGRFTYKTGGVGVDVSQAQMEDVGFGLMFPPLEIFRWIHLVNSDFPVCFFGSSCFKEWHRSSW